MFNQHIPPCRGAILNYNHSESPTAQRKLLRGIIQTLVEFDGNFTKKQLAELIWQQDASPPHTLYTLRRISPSKMHFSNRESEPPHLIQDSLDPHKPAPNGILMDSAILTQLTRVRNTQTTICVTCVLKRRTYAMRACGRRSHRTSGFKALKC